MVGRRSSVGRYKLDTLAEASVKLSLSTERVCVEQHIAVESQLRGHSDPETAAKLVIHTAVAYSQLRGLNEFAFDTEATSTCAVSGVCMGKLRFTRPLCGWASCVCIADRDGVIYWHHSDTRH